jgi:hypothetical protein
VIAEFKAYFKTVLAQAGVPEKAVYLDAAEAQRHKGLPYAVVLTAQDSEGEKFTRLPPRTLLNKFRPSDYPTAALQRKWERMEARFERRSFFEVTIAAASLAAAETVLAGFLAGLADGIVIDPEAPQGYILEGSGQAVSSRNFYAAIEPRDAIWSDSLAHIQDKAIVNLRVEVVGVVAEYRVRETIQGLTMTVESGGEEVGDDQE